MKLKNKILMISQAPFPPDIRLEKEIKSLSEVGYKVLVICNQYDKNLVPDFSFCEIKRVKAIFKSVKLNRIINFPLFVNPRYLIIIFICILKFNPDYIHAHDLPMMPLAILFGKIFKIQVIFDMHENYPEALKEFRKKGIINYLFKNYKTAKLLEKICLKISDFIITVVRENSERLIRQGVDENKIYLVSNTVDLDTFNKEPIEEPIINKYQDKIILMYSGYITPERGLDVVVRGTGFLKDKLKNVKLLIIGDGISVPILKKLVDELALNSSVEFIEWPGHNKLSSYFRIANICISPQPRNDFWNTTIPHKLFEYMSQSKPILAADSRAVKRIIEETQSGITYKSGDPNDFADKVSIILNSNISFGVNGLKAVKNKYNWENESKALLKMYSDLEKFIN